MKRRGWTREQLSFLRENYESLTGPELSRIMGKSVRAIYNTTHSLGLRKSLTTPIKSMGKTMRAYIAGLFDGDGHLGIHRDRERFSVRINLGTASLEFAEWLVNKTGLSGPYSAKNGRFHQMAKYNREESKRFIEQILPYLYLKRPAAEICLQWINGELFGEDAIRKLEEQKWIRTGRSV